MSEQDDSITCRSTGLIHHPYRPPAAFEAPTQGVFKASTVYFADTAAMRSSRWIDKSAYTYGLHGTPTTFVLEERLATLEGGRHAILAPSGLAAITLVDIALLKSGDHLLLPDNAYGPGRRFAKEDLSRWGITHGIYDPMDAASLAAALTPATRLVWLEAPGSVTLEFPDLPALVRTVREQAPQAVIAMDNTWGAGLAFDAFALGVDLTVHALTKYPSGGGDVLMGSVVSRDDALHHRLAWAHSRLGFGVGLNDVEAILRSLPSLPLRYAAQDAAGRRFAQWCGTRGEFARVLHPAMPGSPGHAHWAALCKAAAGLVTVEFDPRYSAKQVDAFVDALERFRIGWSWGGPVSLAVPYQAAEMRGLPTPYRGTLVRFCLGLEAVDDLIADATQALRALG
ncbi:PLP-dependent transferase [Aquincola sp. MAHUQ-54]|uniref:PLP-dependent transferase n=1 Tax=Aquincola agrisoli TaxID=3119538 RepID=A0AAW9QA78_9BURK